MQIKQELNERERGSVSALDTQPRTHVARHMNQTFSSICRQDRNTIKKYGSQYHNEDKIQFLMRQIKQKKQTNMAKRNENQNIRTQLRDELQKNHKLQHEMPPNMVPKNTDVQNSNFTTLRSPGLSKYPKGTQSDTLPKSNEE